METGKVFEMLPISVRESLQMLPIGVRKVLHIIPIGGSQLSVLFETAFKLP